MTYLLADVFKRIPRLVFIHFVGSYRSFLDLKCSDINRIAVKQFEINFALAFLQFQK